MRCRLLYYNFAPGEFFTTTLVNSEQVRTVFISLQQLEQKPVPFHVDLPAGELEFDSSITQTTPVKAEGRAELLSHSLGEIRVAGKLDVTVTAVCDRCLDPTAFPLQKDFDLVYVPSGEASGGEAEVDAAGIEVGFYEGHGIELNDVLREVVLLALPMQFTCGEDCKGICPVCGANRNQADCDCQTKPEDERWNGLKNLRSIAPSKG